MRGRGDPVGRTVDIGHTSAADHPVPAFPVMHIPVPRRGRRSRWPIARFYPLLPLLAKVGRSGERNIPTPKSAEHPPRRDEGLQFA